MQAINARFDSLSAYCKVLYLTLYPHNVQSVLDLLLLAAQLSRKGHKAMEMKDTVEYEGVGTKQFTLYEYVL